MAVGGNSPIGFTQSRMYMEKNYCIINTGSASKKYALYRGDTRVFFAHFETEGGAFVVSIERGTSERRHITETDFINSFEYLLKELASTGVVADPQKHIAGIGFRIVAPGKYFSEHRLIDDLYVERLRAEKQAAPLHIAPMLLELENVRRLLPAVSVVGVSDSAFHASLPERAFTYALAHDVAEKFDIRKFGYHGSSLSSIVKKTEPLLGRLPARMIVCHLGSGSSITALKDGTSIDTSMGFSPLEGVPMGTRVGDIDPGAVIRVAAVLKCSLEELEQYFYTRSGLLGISGKSNDIRDLLALELQGDMRAKLALDVFVYRIKKYIGAYVAALGGLDALVFSATIGERSFIIRERICHGLDVLGIVLDETKNTGVVSRDGFIHKEGSRARIVVMTTDETGEIARETRALLG